MDLREVQHPTRSQIQGFPRGVSHKPNGILVFSIHFQLFILPLVISKPFFAAKLGPPAYRFARGFVLYFGEWDYASVQSIHEVAMRDEPTFCLVGEDLALFQRMEPQKKLRGWEVQSCYVLIIGSTPLKFVGCTLWIWISNVSLRVVITYVHSWICKPRPIYRCFTWFTYSKSWFPIVMILQFQFMANIHSYSKSWFPIVLCWTNSSY